MNARQNVKSGSSIERQLESVQMSQQMRKAALNDACIAERFVDAIAWVGGKVQRLNADVFAKPSPKY
jgi:hypothetical protein